MQRIMGYMRRAIQQYDMIQDGDVIAAGVSGGKDSLALLVCMAGLRRYIGIDFELKAVTADPRFGGEEGDYSSVSEYCREQGIEYRIERTDIGQVVFDIRHETNPCSLCAKMRRGAIHSAAKEMGCNKLALGHHFDDAVETFMMNLLNEGRIGCFSPVSYLDRRDITIIRPMVLAPEKEIMRAAKRLPVAPVPSRCPADGHTNRQKTKELILELEKQYKGAAVRIFGAMQRGDIDGWGIKK